MRKFGGGRVAVVQFYLVQSFWYFLLCTTLGEFALSWSSIGSSVASQNHSLCQILRCSGVDLCLWMGDNGVALSMVKRAHLHYSHIMTYYILTCNYSLWPLLRRGCQEVKKKGKGDGIIIILLMARNKI